jgi:hypothetical protein
VRVWRKPRFAGSWRCQSPQPWSTKVASTDVAQVPSGLSRHKTNDCTFLPLTMPPADDERTTDDARDVVGYCGHGVDNNVEERNPLTHNTHIFSANGTLRQSSYLDSTIHSTGNGGKSAREQRQPTPGLTTSRYTRRRPGLSCRT